MPERTDFDPKNIEELLSLNSRAYDLVMNGEELGGGSIRIHDMKIQKKIFRALGLSRDEAEAKFGFFLKALEYGAPPHAGLALGIDRVIAMILKTSSIRDVIAFPKNRKAYCPLTKAPSYAEKLQLKELGLSSGAGVIKFTDDKESGWEEGSDAGSTLQREKISAEEVKHVAKLARLNLSHDETEGYRKDLNSILDYVAALENIDTADILPMSHVLDIRNVWRDDTPEERDNPLDLLENAPEREEEYYKVPKILEGN
jgi:aspartyl-tRNA synthetase